MPPSPPESKNKYGAMKRDWWLWKFLKTGETRLGRDPITGKIQALKEWWEKIMVRLLPTIEDLWNQLFQDGYATGADVVSTNIDPSSVNVENVHDERNGEDNNDYVGDNCEKYNDANYPPYYPSLDDLDNRLDDLEIKSEHSILVAVVVLMLKILTNHPILGEQKHF
ncbi:Coatomer subunit gamma [Bienertia sinuspersici]